MLERINLAWFSVIFFFFTLVSTLYAAPEDWTISAIVCRGNESVDCDYLRKELNLKVGDKLKESELIDSQIRMGLLRLVESAKVFIEKSEMRDQVNVIIEVIEQSPISYQAIGFSEVDNFLGTTTPIFGVGTAVNHGDIFGNAEIMQLSALFSKRNSYHSIAPSMRLLIPNLRFSMNTFFSAGLNLLYTKSDFSRYSSTSPFLQIGHRFSSILIGTLTYEHRWMSTEYYDSAGVPQWLDPKRKTNFGVVTLGVLRDTLDDARFPKMGSKTFLGFQVATKEVLHINLPAFSIDKFFSLSPSQALEFNVEFGPLYSVLGPGQVTSGKSLEDRSPWDRINSVPLGLSYHHDFDSKNRSRLSATVGMDNPLGPYSYVASYFRAKRAKLAYTTEIASLDLLVNFSFQYLVYSGDYGI